jgi:hypothetical protein
MEFKLGASLWGASADAKPMAPQQEPAEDFGRKLGLATRQETQPHDRQPLPEQGSVHSDQAEWQAALLQLEQRKAPRSAPQVELYGWGSLAGHHLSHMPGAFAGDSLPLAMPRLLQAGAGLTAGQTALSTEPTPTAMGSVRSQPVASLPTPATSPSVRDASATESGALQAFLAQRWPERRLLLLPRDNGTEVIIRDFHLSEEEQRTLARDLQHFLQGTGEPLEQIWVNGRLAWQREPIQ